MTPEEWEQHRQALDAELRAADVAWNTADEAHKRDNSPENWRRLKEAAVAYDEADDALDQWEHPTPDDATGFNVAPARYTEADGREVIDDIREELGDEGFMAFCRGTAMAYERRAGKKGSYQEDMTKASWYRQMHAHVKDNAPDPRVYRKKT